METIRLANFTMCKMGVEEYNSTYGANAQEQYGHNLTGLIWFEQYNKEGEVVAMSGELALEYEDGTFAHTSRGTVQKCDLYYALEVIMWLEEL